jgi:hypothetical protein
MTISGRGVGPFYAPITSCATPTRREFERTRDLFLGLVLKELSSRTPWKSRGIGRFLSVILAFCAQAGQKEA